MNYQIHVGATSYDVQIQRVRLERSIGRPDSPSGARFRLFVERSGESRWTVVRNGEWSTFDTEDDAKQAAQEFVIRDVSREN